jgi:hypothetical protein
MIDIDAGRILPLGTISRRPQRDWSAGALPAGVTLVTSGANAGATVTYPTDEPLGVLLTSVAGASKQATLTLPPVDLTAIRRLTLTLDVLGGRLGAAPGPRQMWLGARTGADGTAGGFDIFSPYNTNASLRSLNGAGTAVDNVLARYAWAFSGRHCIRLILDTADKTLTLAYGDDMQLVKSTVLAGLTLATVYPHVRVAGIASTTTAQSARILNFNATVEV